MEMKMGNSQVQKMDLMEMKVCNIKNEMVGSKM